MEKERVPLEPSSAYDDWRELPSWAIGAAETMYNGASDE